MADEPERWQSLMRQHGPALLLFARQWSATPSDADDALQAGFLKFWTSRARARDELAYLYACVRSAAMDMDRTQRRRAARDQATELPPPSAFDLSLERSERQARIESALNQLPADQREVVVMKIWGGLTFAQIGQALAVPLHTAASRYRMALARLAADLAREMAHE